MSPEENEPAHYRARDVFRVPGLLSLARVPLAFVFPFVVSPFVALAVLLVAGFTDVMDGWYARRYRQVTATGAVLDPITDKIFVATVALTLIMRGHLPLYAVVLLATREIVELPLVLWIAFSHHARRMRTQHAAANLPGKLATALQFGCAISALFGSSSTLVWAYAAAATGLVAAILYWARATRAAASPSGKRASSDVSRYDEKKH